MMTLKDLRNQLNNLPNSIEVHSTARAYLEELKTRFIGQVTELAKDPKGKYEFNHFKCLKDKTEVGIRGFLIELECRLSNFNDLCLRCLQPYTKPEDFREFANLFFDASGNCLDRRVMTENIKAGRDFYRIRPTDESNPYELFNHKNMYMMGSDLSAKVGMARFNLSGYPCLYLAESLYLAWEECRRPDFHTANFTRFRNCRILTVLDLTIPEGEKLKSKAAFFRTYVSLVCSAKSKDNDRDHWQYRISNLFIRMIYQLNDKSIDGIKYMSSRRFENKNFRLDYTKECAAYVFPPKSVEDTHCRKLASLFEMTEAFSYFYFKIYGVNFISSKKAATREYDNTIFAFLESKLQEQPTHSCIKKIIEEP